MTLPRDELYFSRKLFSKKQGIWLIMFTDDFIKFLSNFKKSDK